MNNNQRSAGTFEARCARSSVCGNLSMHILITGAGGMIGRKLTARLLRDGALNGRSIDRLTLVDVSAPPKSENFGGAVESIAADISEAAAFTALIDARPDVIFHLAA